MSKITVPPEVIGEIILLFVQKGIPAGIELLSTLKDQDITAEKVRALRTGLNPPVKY